MQPENSTSTRTPGWTLPGGWHTRAPCSREVRGRGRRGRLAVLDAGALYWGSRPLPKTGRERVKSLLSRAMDGLSHCLPARALRAQIFPRVREGRAPAV